MLHVCHLISGLLLRQQHELQPSCSHPDVVELSQSRRMVCFNSATCRSESAVESIQLCSCGSCSDVTLVVATSLDIFCFVLCSLALSAAVWM